MTEIVLEVVLRVFFEAGGGASGGSSDQRRRRRGGDGCCKADVIVMARDENQYTKILPLTVPWDLRAP